MRDFMVEKISQLRKKDRATALARRRRKLLLAASLHASMHCVATFSPWRLSPRQLVVVAAVADCQECLMKGGGTKVSKCGNFSRMIVKKLYESVAKFVTCR
jgi:hypothetical protein